jgi:hypothetical protein
VSDANIFLMFFAKQIGTKCQHFWLKIVINANK